MEEDQGSKGPLLLMNVIGGLFIAVLLYRSFSHSHTIGSFGWTFLLIGAYFAFARWWKKKYFHQLSPEMQEVYQSASERGKISGRWIGIAAFIVMMIIFWYFVF